MTNTPSTQNINIKVVLGTCPLVIVVFILGVLAFIFKENILATFDPPKISPLVSTPILISTPVPLRLQILNATSRKFQASILQQKLSPNFVGQISIGNAPYRSTSWQIKYRNVLPPVISQWQQQNFIPQNISQSTLPSTSPFDIILIIGSQK